LDLLGSGIEREPCLKMGFGFLWVIFEFQQQFCQVESG